LALWGSGDELWDIDLKNRLIRRENQLPQLKVNQDLNEIETLNDYIPYTHPGDATRFNRAFVAHLKGRTPAFELRFRTAKIEGGWTWVLVRGRVVQRDPSGRVTRVVGTMRSIDASVAIEEELRSLNEALESRVSQRTEELEETLNQLRSMQEELVQSEKMASLGGLVAGVAHEINTPIGVSVTAGSHLEEETRRLKLAFDSQQMTRAALETYLGIAMESCALILRNLKRAAGLIKSFKQVAVDQSSEARREFLLSDYLSEILTSLKPELKRTRHRVELDVPADITMQSYPGALTQVIVNLTMNSLIHGFEGIEAGVITIRARQSAGTVALTYTDSGVGLTAQVRSRIFDPFFTTKRGQGGSGLGMHIVYNLVTGVLGGTIQAGGAPNAGIEILMSLPLKAPERNAL
jgi:C4-dicarboxylate-specific signal transduction histidine kinase